MAAWEGRGIRLGGGRVFLFERCIIAARAMLFEAPPGAGMTNSAPAAKSSSARIVGEIIRGLYDGAYVPGQRLSEPELMEWFSVSRSTARESIHRMEAEGIVDVFPFKGAVIRRMSPEEALDATLVMQMCVGLAARLAAERIDQTGNRTKLQTAWTALLDFEGTGENYEFVRARDRFYRVMTELSRNRELQRIFPTVHVHLIRRNYPLTARERFDDYRRIVAAILEGNGAAAEKAARDHVGKIAALVRDQSKKSRPQQGGGY
jgi:DNA-binding GntR family transcriptional regulator